MSVRRLLQNSARILCANKILRKMRRNYAIILTILLIIGLWQLFTGSKFGDLKSVKDLESNNDFIGRIAQKKLKQKDLSKRTGLTTNDTNFLLDGKRFIILSGEIHYFRFPQEYWRDRLLALKASGLNTVTTYIPWNSHEPRPGFYDFAGMLDLSVFLDLCDEMGIYVILRVGPYICAEWEYGGLPSWLLRTEAKVRTSDPIFMKYVNIWFDKLLPLIVPHQYKKGGAVIAVQVENEYSSFPYPDPFYIKKLKDIVDGSGISELLFVCDDRNGIIGNDHRINYVGMLKSMNLQNKPANGLRELKKMQPRLPMFVSEYWTGWFDWWGGPHHNLGVPWLNSFTVPAFTNTTRELLSTGASMNLYVFAGGTNFGFMNGGMIEEKDRDNGNKVSPDITSYDYTAPVSEEGRLTGKYFALRSLLYHLNLTHKDLPDPPPQPHLASYDSVQFSDFVTLGQLLEAFKSWMIKSDKPMSMERFPAIAERSEGQSYGYALYECSVTGSDQFLLDLAPNVRDRALVFLDTVYQSTFAPPLKTVRLRANSEGKHTLSFLVENQGRVNWVAKQQKGIMENQHKGIVGDVKCNDEILKNWRMWPLDFDSLFLKKFQQHVKDGTLKWKRGAAGDMVPPLLLRATLNLGYSKPMDTFVELEGFEKGFVIVNGINLGRYWNSAGPQKRLYLPGPWLHSGENEILVFEERTVGERISFHDSCGIS